MGLTPTNQMVKNLVVVQDAYVNTYHPDFMGGSNSIMSMFDPANAKKLHEQNKKAGFNIEALQSRGPASAGINLDVGDGEPGPSNKDRVKHIQDYEINKYINQDMKPIHMPRMASFKRAEDDDPGQSSPRATMETTIIKNLISSYFATVRKTMNDMVP